MASSYLVALLVPVLRTELLHYDSLLVLQRVSQVVVVMGANPRLLAVDPVAHFVPNTASRHTALTLSCRRNLLESYKIF
jgi:hypothetical protein